MTTRRPKQGVLSLIDSAQSAAMEKQLIEQQRVIDYDTKEFTVELIVQKFESSEFYIPPYQRQFIWSEERQSKFIESILLGLPIPFIFCAENEDGRLEVVDGGSANEYAGSLYV